MNEPVFDRTPKYINIKDTDPIAEDYKYGKESEVELHNLLYDESFSRNYITTSTSEETDLIDSINGEPGRKALLKIQELINEKASSDLGSPDVTSAKKLGKAFGEARKNVRSILFNEKTYDLDDKQFNSDLLAEIVKEYPLDNDRLILAQEAQELASTYSESEIKALRAELMTQFDNPVLLEALEVWGKSPDSAGNTGESGLGYNAGVIHFFQYRSDTNKSGRFKIIDKIFSIGAFIQRSQKLKAVIQDPESHTEVVKFAQIVDEDGNSRLFVLTKEDYIVAFQKPGESMKVVTIMRAQDHEKGFDKKVEASLSADDSQRLNKLGQTKTILRRR